MKKTITSHRRELTLPRNVQGVPADDFPADMTAPATAARKNNAAT
ncbi:MAG TPA: hypothetical protein VEX43_03005 [Chthoniobacterales bacterium]|nr:hypothetical protein [Chthoniobacterales bacterium]